MFQILVVEDDKTLNKLICTKLKQEQFHVISAFDGAQALDVLDTEYVDLMVTDLMMPNMDGYSLIQSLRKANYMLPILIITAKSQMDDLEHAFLVGTDDYMIKPINMKEMILRIKALLKRAQITNAKKMQIGNTLLNYDTLQVIQKEQIFDLPPKEFYLLFKLLANPDKIFTRIELLDEIWGMEHDTDERNVDSHIKKLRKKFEPNEDFELLTIRGLGYKSHIKSKNK